MWRVGLFGFLTLFMIWAQTPAQDNDLASAFAGRQFSAEQAAAAEAAVSANPEDAAARESLLGYYWAHTAQAAALLNHLLWLIAHRPDAGVFVLPEASIVDAAAFEQVKQAWSQAVATHANEPRVLANAAWFFRVRDPRQAIELSRRALALEPQNRLFADRLGNAYAMVLACVTDLDHSGRPARFDRTRTDYALEQSVRTELDQSTQAAVLYATGTALSGFASEAKTHGEDFAAESALAAQLVERARSLDASVVPQRIRVGGNVQAANLVKKVNPVYPGMARQARIQGTVRFNVIIARDGTVQNLQVVSGHPLLIPPALDAVKQWEYKPVLLNGAPVEVATTVDVNFTLAPNSAQP